MDHIANALTNGAARADVERRFEAIASSSRTESGCRLWRGAKAGNGYGSFKLAPYINVGAHRLAWALANGRSPGALFVCHRCDNPLCVAPEHLFLGTHEDNMRDRDAKGRARQAPQTGERNNGAKLTEDDVVRIRRRISWGEDNTSIARRFGVSHSLISAIRRGKVWTMVGAAGIEPATSAV